MKTKIGSRVLALRNTEGTTAYIFGYGTYDGDLPCPLMSRLMDPVSADEIRNVMRKQADEMRDMLMHDMIRDEAGQAIAKAMVAEYEACTDADFVVKADNFNAKYANPEGQANPRITLDSGGVVWGCQCWWGEAGEFDKKLDGMERVIVPLPADDVAGDEESAMDELDAEDEIEVLESTLADDADHDAAQYEADPLEDGSATPGWDAVETSTDD